MEPHQNNQHGQPIGQSFSPPPDHHRRTNMIIATLVGLSVVLLVTTIWFATLYMRQNGQIDTLVLEQIQSQLAEQEQELRTEFKAEQESNTTTYSGPDVYGNVQVQYPKSWSSFVRAGTSEQPVSVIFHPETVREDTVSHGLRMVVFDQNYEQFMSPFQSRISSKEVTAATAKSNGVTGVRLEGAVTSDKNDDGFAVIFPIRDKTLALWTESREFKSVFDQAVKNLKFTP